MNFKLTIVAITLSAFALTACTKKEEAPKSDVTTTETPAEVQVSAEQQALIDSVDKPDPAAIAIDETVDGTVADAEQNPTAEAPKQSTGEPTEQPSQPSTAEATVAQATTTKAVTPTE